MSDLDARDRWIYEDVLRRAVLETCADVFPHAMASWGTPAKILAFINYPSAEYLAASPFGQAIPRKFREIVVRERIYINWDAIRGTKGKNAPTAI